MAMRRALNAPPFAALCKLGLLCLVEGAWDEAARHLEEAVAGAERFSYYEGYAWAQRVLAELDLMAARPAAAQARLLALLESPTKSELDHAFLLPMLAWASLQLGEASDADATASRASTRARAERNMLALAEALGVQALVAMEQERWADARHALDEGLALTRRIGYPYAEGRLLATWGRLHTRRGEREPARARLEGALAIFRRLGARRDAERTEHALLSLSGAPRPRSPAPAVTAVQWRQIHPLLPPPRRGRGRPRADDRAALEAILYKWRTGCAWNAIPTEFGDGVTAYRRLRHWQALGLWEPMERILGLTQRDPQSDDHTEPPAAPDG
jgi:hypothetical protein